MKFLRIILACVYLAAANVAFAQGALATAGESFRSLVTKAGNWVSNTIFPILVAMAVLAFFYNLVFFIFHMDNEKERETFKKYSVNAIIVLFVMLTVWGIVGIVTQTFFNANPVIPQLPTSD